MYKFFSIYYLGFCQIILIIYDIIILKNQTFSLLDIKVSANSFTEISAKTSCFYSWWTNNSLKELVLRRKSQEKQKYFVWPSKKHQKWFGLNDVLIRKLGLILSDLNSWDFFFFSLSSWRINLNLSNACIISSTCLFWLY